MLRPTCITNGHETLVSMQVHQLAYFVAVARERHFTRAAEETGVSQPNLSKQVRALENALGTQLFVRGRSGVELTSAGEALLPHAERILIEVETAQRSVHEVTSLRRGRVRLGATPAICEGLLPEALTAFRAIHPGIDLEVQEGGSGLLTRDLSEGRLDVALLIAPLRVDAPDLVTTPVLRERLVLASPRDTDMPDHLRIAELDGLPLVMFREGYDLREVTGRACRDAGFSPTVAIEGGEMGGVLRFVEAGLGHAVVPAMVLPSRPALQASTLGEPPLERVIAISHRRTETLPLAVRGFVEELTAHLRRISSPALRQA